LIVNDLNGNTNRYKVAFVTVFLESIQNKRTGIFNRDILNMRTTNPFTSRDGPLGLRLAPAERKSKKVQISRTLAWQAFRRDGRLHITIYTLKMVSTQKADFLPAV
jgi:hypothetical protein